MIITPISKEQCINKLRHYANTEIRSWSLFDLFKKKPSKNHTVALELANNLEKTSPSDNDLLKIASAIDGFEDSELQHDLLCFLNSNINNDPKPFVAQRKNIEQIKQSLNDLVEKKYRPWWALFLIEKPYYSDTFRANVNWFTSKIDELFTQRREETKNHILNAYSNDQIANQIISDYNKSGNPDNNQQNELHAVLQVALDQTENQTRRALIKEIKKTVLENLHFGQLLISATGLSSIITSYLLKEENQNKPVQEQAQEIIYIIGKVFLQVNAAQLVKSVSPGLTEVVEAVVSVVTAQSPVNPLHTDRKFGLAFAGVAGGTFGGALGTMVPVIGTAFGAYVGAIVSKTVATKFYQVLEAWQTAPEEGSRIPRYPRAYFSLVDNDAANILEPVYVRYVNAEKELKKLGDDIAKWFSIYITVLQNSDESVSSEYLEIIDEEMKRLQSEFIKLQNTHSMILEPFYKAKTDNPARVEEYIAKIKVCLEPMNTSIEGIFGEYYSPAIANKPKTGSQSYAGILSKLPAISGTMSPPSAVIIAKTETNPRDLTKQLSGNDLCDYSPGFVM